MAVIRIRALEVLRDVINRLCPDLNGNICAGPAEHPHRQKFPHLSMLPINYVFHPDQDGEIVEESEESPTALFKVGRHVAEVQLRLGAKTARQRYALEHGLSQIFVSQRGRPGILLIRIPDCHNATIAYELERTQWQNELAFDKEWYSLIVLTMQVPALVERGGMYTIQDLRLAFTEDVLTEPATDIPANRIETVSIAEDGTITAVP